jgi:hypothetical protein
MPGVAETENVGIRIQDPELTDIPSEILTQPLQDAPMDAVLVDGFSQPAHHGGGDGSKPFLPLRRADVIEAQNVVKRTLLRVA